MNPNNFRIQRLDGTIYNMKDIGVIVNRLVIESPSPIHHRERIEGVDGYIDLGTEYGGRNILADCTLTAVDLLDYALARDEVFRIFDSKQPFYLLPDESPGKRILVKYDSPYSMARVADIGEFSLTFVSNDAYFESIGTTLDPKTFDAEVWQVGQGLTVDETKYTHTTKTFQIYNAGDVTINPRMHPLVIEYKGQSLNLSIKNLTTGDEWVYSESIAPLEVVRIDGIRSFKDNDSIFSKTNHKLITIQPGWNDFEISGPVGFDEFEISFSFRFYYL